MALALCRIHNDADAEFARRYLKEAGYKALNGELREKKALADLQNVGHAVTEGPLSLVRECSELVSNIAAAFERARRKQQALDREPRAPVRLVRSPDKEREDRQ